jgi:hypothetical protein
LDIVVLMTQREMNFLHWYMSPEGRDQTTDTTRKQVLKMLWYVYVDTVTIFVIHMGTSVFQ